MWDNWLVDVSTIDGAIATFCPYEDGELIIGMNFVSDKCPGNLIGAFHPAGQEAVEEYMEQNPEILERFINYEIEGSNT